MATTITQFVSDTLDRNPWKRQRERVLGVVVKHVSYDITPLTPTSQFVEWILVCHSTVTYSLEVTQDIKDSQTHLVLDPTLTTLFV